MTVEQITNKDIGPLYRYPSSPDYWIAHIDDFDFMVPCRLWEQGDGFRKQAGAVYVAAEKYISLAQQYLTASGGHREMDIEDPDWHPLWIEIKQGDELFLELGFQLTGDLYGDWIATVKDGVAQSCRRV